MARKRTGAASTTIQAPCANLVISTTTKTSAVAAAPSPLMACLCLRDLRSRGLSSTAIARDQWRTIPVWLSVKERKTPRM